MSPLAETIFFVFGLVALGYLCGWTGFLRTEVGDALSDFAVAVAVPMLLFRTMVNIDFGGGLPLALWATYFPGIVVTWNGSGFDLPFLAERARRLGVTLGLDLWDDGPERTEPGVVRGRWYAHDHLDGYRLYRADVGRSLGFPCGLKPLSRLVGLAPVEVDRSCIHLLDDAALEAYVASDARLARELVLRRWPVAERATDRCHPRPPD